MKKLETRNLLLILLLVLTCYSEILTLPKAPAAAPSATSKYSQKVRDVRAELAKTFPKHGVCGIMGNIAVEAPSFDYKTKQVGGNGYGLFQFDYMKTFYFKYLTR